MTALQACSAAADEYTQGCWCVWCLMGLVVSSDLLLAIWNGSMTLYVHLGQELLCLL